MDGETLYIVGPGSTTGAVMEAMGLPHTLLGVDLVKGRKLVKADATDADINAAIARHGGRAEVIAGVTGRQGFVFGRGNLQISPEVLRQVGKKNITIVAAERKVGLDAALQGTQALLDQLRNHVALQHLRRHIRQRHPTPQRQRLPQQPRVRLPVTRTGRLARLLKQDLEAADVDVATRCRQHVPARPTLQHLLEGEALP